MKKIILTSFLLSIILSLGSFKKNNENTNITTPITCKWMQIRCRNGGWIEGCLSSGNGNECTCGQVTRDCGGSR